VIGHGNVVPCGVGRAADICFGPVKDVDEAGGDAARHRYEIAELVGTSRALSSERNIRKLLDLILRKCRQVTGADAGSVYVVEGDGPVAEKTLHFMLSQNDSVDIDFKESILGVDEKSIVGRAVLEARPINIADLEALAAPGKNPWGIHHNRSFDDKSGYRARSMLTIPMLSAHDEVIGVIQLINRKEHAEQRLLTSADLEREVIPFDPWAEQFALALASQAGLSLENATLYGEINDLFEGFVAASVTAIESRDPTTSGHSRRVATLTVALAQMVDALTEGPFADVRFSRDDLRQIEYAAMLHDFGKVGVRERVLIKPRKLYEEDLRAIQLRFAYIRKTLEVEALEGKLRLMGERGGDEGETRLSEIDANQSRRATELDDLLAFVTRANEPTLLEQGGPERLRELGRQTYIGPSGEQRPFLEPEEIAALLVRRGSLTDIERVQIQSHVVHTHNFLQRIPWGRNLRKIPDIARAHHEYLNGTGYPQGLSGAAIPIEPRMITIADIFDALTASDRPYKRAVPIDRALVIVQEEVKAGKLDAALFDVFVDSEVYKAVL
jgi:HD-GYP domain-containing protein (c-di-GMP phosphodiesterase class II)